MNKFKSALISTGIAVGGLLLIGLFIFLSSDVLASPPDNLRIIADHKYKTIISPQCANPNVDYNSTDFSFTTIQEARDMGYEYDSSCTEDSLFPSRNSAWDFIGTKIGFLKPVDWKWNDDGTWKEEAFK